jgi:hypothetical protein
MAQNEQNDAPDLLYGVFLGSRWGMTRNREAALNAARGVAGAEVRAMPEPDSTSWDAPTFRLLSDQIYPEAVPAEATWPKAVC